jgi:hypothetical protein
MTILITEPGEYVEESKDSPIVGRRYSLEDATSGTGAQNRAAHALMAEYFRTGLHSYPAKTFAEFRDYIKRDLGAGFESFVYASPAGVKKVATREEIPPEYNNAKYAMGRLLSWSDYTLRQRRETIDRLIAEMVQAGVNTPKFFEILEGMDGHEKQP